MQNTKQKNEALIGGSELNAGLHGIETVQVIGFEWVRPRSFWSGDSGEYSGAVSIKTNVGTLVLARLESFSGGVRGGFRRVLVKPEELNVQDA